MMAASGEWLQEGGGEGEERGGRRGWVRRGVEEEQRK
jgi:hypothetical protein